MKVYAWFGLLLLANFCFAQGKSYSTSFPLTENPISEGGNWISAGTSVGTTNAAVHTASGMAFGLECVSRQPCNDSTAVLAGVWGANQAVSGTVFSSPLSRACGQEVELRTNTWMAGANKIKGYEFDFSVNDGALLIVRWDDSAPGYTILAMLNGSVAHNGDVLKATNTNGTLRAYKNGNLMLTAHDRLYTGGSPGIGMNFTNWPGCIAASEDLKYGFSDFSASDSGVILPLGPAPPGGLIAIVP